MLMMDKRLQSIRRAFLELVLKGKADFEKESEGLGYYLSVLSTYKDYKDNPGNKSVDNFLLNFKYR